MSPNTQITCQSETGKLKRVYLKSIAEAFRNQDNVNQQWASLNFLNCPSYSDGLLEYASFVNILRKSGCEINFFKEDQATGMDSIYCRDASIATDHGMIMCNMGKELRKGEPDAQQQVFVKNKLTILGKIEGNGTIEGGDVAWLDQNTLAVGHGYRSNMEGYEQLCALLQPKGINLIQVQLPHYKGINDVFHLMSIFSPVADDLAVVYSPLMPVFFRNHLLDRGFQLVEIPDHEFESMGCNVMALSPGNCVIVQGNPETKTALEKAGCTVHEYSGKNISVLGGGGPTCLTRPIFREV